MTARELLEDILRSRRARPVELRYLGTAFEDAGDGLADHARCRTCGAVVDVGAELREHAEYHADTMREP